jgi:hypothetical protein
LDALMNSPEIDGINVFLWEASIPFFNAFVDKYYNLEDEQLRLAVPDHRSIISNATDTILQLFLKLKSCANYTSKRYFRALTSVLMVFDKKVSFFKQYNNNNSATECKIK